MKEILIPTIKKKIWGGKRQTTNYEKEHFEVCAPGITETELQLDAAEIAPWELLQQCFSALGKKA